MRDILGYGGTRCVVVGAATGMGEACARTLVDLGAEVIALDIAPVNAPVKQSIHVDLADPASIAEAAGQIDGEVPKLFVCAGVPGPPRWDALATMRVNFVGVREITERLLPRVPKGGAVALISSVAGVGYAKNLDELVELCGTEGFDAAMAWCEAHPEIGNLGYLGSKQALIVYTKLRASQLVERGVRMNCLLPSPTDTPMLVDFHAQVGGAENLAAFVAPCGRNATSEEMAEPLILLNSDAASFVNGHDLPVDYGYCGEVDVGVRARLL